MKTLLLLILLQVSYPEYEWKSTSSYPTVTQEHYTPNDYSSNRPGPKKVSGIDGWAFWLLWGSSHNVPSSASNSDMYDYYNYVQSGGTMSYQQWYD